MPVLQPTEQTYSMANFRQNHTKQNSAAGGGMIAKGGVFAIIAGVLYFLFSYFGGGDIETMQDQWEEIGDKTEEPNTYPDRTTSTTSDFTDYDYLPTSTTGDVIQHKYYTLSYSEPHEQAEWVAYKLTKSSIQAPNVRRTNDFRTDPKVASGSADLSDYRGSGYDRGHLAPAGDMAFNQEAMSESFFMSNMSPQARQFNGGIWRELEELTRDWAYKFKELYVVTGPLFDEQPKGRIGDNKVTIPANYFKVLLDLSQPEQKGIAFILPNRVNFEPLYKYAVSIDEVEERSGIDFFPDLMNDRLEAEMESSQNVDLWPFSKKKFELRNDKWNNR